MPVEIGVWYSKNPIFGAHTIIQVRPITERLPDNLVNWVGDESSGMDKGEFERRLESRSTGSINDASMRKPASDPVASRIDMLA